MNSSELKKIFLDICRGFSFSKKLNLYIKHLSIEEDVECELVKEDAYENAVELGIPKSDDVLAECLKNGSWTTHKEGLLKKFENDYRQLNHSRFTPISENQLEALREELNLIESEWVKLSQEKYALLYNSAERMADRAFSDQSLLLCLFRDKELKIPAYDEESFEYLDDFIFDRISREVSVQLGRFKIDNLNLLAIEPFFQRRLSVSSDLFDFFGKPSYLLSEYQISLLKLGEKFKSMLDEIGEVKEDYSTPEGIEDYFYLKRANVLKTDQEIAAERAKWD